MKPQRFLEFLLYYVWEVVRSNLRVASDVLRRTPRISPGIVAVPLEPMTDRQLFLLTNLITMTPGTLSLDLAQDRRTLFVHTMYARQPDEVRDQIKSDLERRVRNVF